MIQISNNVRAIGASPTIAMAEHARLLRGQGRPIISLASGEPDYDTPEHIRRAACEAMERGETRYTDVAGTLALRRAVADKFRIENDIDYAPDEIIVSTGAKQIIYNAFLASLNEGDEVIIPAPYWVSYPEMVRLTGGVPVVVPCHADDGFKLTPAAFSAAITPRTRWLLLNSPNNPSGAVYRADELSALARIVLEHPQISVISDDIYEHIRYDDLPFFTMAQVEPRLRDRTVTVNGVSKSYAMTGWRIGYASGPRAFVREMVKIQSQTTSNATSVAQAAALAALTGSQECVKRGQAKFLARRDLVLSILGQAVELRIAHPSGAFYVFADVTALYGKSPPGNDAVPLLDDSAVCMYLLEAADVALVPGSAFGAPGAMRMSFAANEDDLRTACNAIVAAIRRLA